MLRPHVQLAAENLFLRKQLVLYLERQVKPRRADDATRIALVAVSQLIERLPAVRAVEIGGWASTIAGGTASVDRGNGDEAFPSTLH